MDSPRGRIVLMAEGLRPESEMSDARVQHFDRCLGCMACVTSCPSGVRYDRLIEATRPQVERNHRRSRRERALRRLLFATFPHPRRLRALVPLLVLSQRLGLTRVARTGRFARAFPRLAALERLAPTGRVRDRAIRPPRVVRASQPVRGRVALLQGCVQRVFFGRVNVATAGVLAAEGFEVHSPGAPACCGALELHSGEEERALARLREAIEAFEGYDAVVVNAAGCGSALKDAGHLLEDDPGWAERAAALSAKVRDVTEVLAEVGTEPRSPRHPVRLRVAYHDACHLAHAQRIRSEPRQVLRSIPGLELLEPAEWELCCGSAGVYNLLQPEAGAELGRRKAANLISTGADAVAAGNPGCALQIAAFAEEAGRPLRVYHPAELLWMSTRGGGAR